MHRSTMFLAAACLLATPAFAQTTRRSSTLPAGVQIQLKSSSTGHRFGFYGGQHLGGHLIYGVASRRAVTRALGVRVSPDKIDFLRVQTDPTRCPASLKTYLAAAGKKLDGFQAREQRQARGLRYAMDYGYIMADNQLLGLFRQGRTGRVMVVGTNPAKPRVLVDR